MDKQIRLFPEEPSNELEVVEMKFVDKNYTNAEELFSGFNHLYAITFSYGLGFIDKVAKYFDTADIIVGCEAMAKYDLNEIMAFQNRSLQEIRRRKNLIERVEKEEVSFWIAKDIISHSKIYILASDSGETRVITGSANFSGRSFSGDQRENIGYFENDAAAFSYYMDEFELLKELSTNKVVRESLYSGDSEDMPVENIPIVKEALVKEAGVIVDNENIDKDQVEFITDVSKISKKYAKIIPKLDKKGNKVLLTPKKANELIRKHKKEIKEEQEKRKEFPQLQIDYEKNEVSMNGCKYCLDSDIDRVKADLLQINEYFSGYDDFIGSSVKAKAVYFKIMNFMFLSPFIAKLRYVAYANGFPEEYFPYYAVVHGPKSAGKSALVDTIQKIMFGKELGRVQPDIFTKTRMDCILREAKGVPVHITDIGKNRFTKGSGEIIKCDERLLDEKITGHPTFVMTSNEIEIIKPEVAKRVYYASVDMTQDNISAASKKKRMVENRKKITTAFYMEYMKRMVPAVKETIEKMENYIVKEDEEIWQPDIFEISSRIISDIYRDCDMDVPEYMSVVSYEDYFKNNTISEKIRNKIAFEWKHNRKAFKAIRRENILEYQAGEHSYDADRVQNALPEILRAKRSGTKVIMKLDEAEKFFNIRFKRKLF